MSRQTFDLLLIYNDVDRPWVIQLKRHLERYRLRVRLDHDEAGSDLPDPLTLEQVLPLSRAAAMVISPEMVNSEWLVGIYYTLTQSGSLSSRLVPLLRGDAASPGFLAKHNQVSFQDETRYEQQVWELVREVTGEKPDKVLPLKSQLSEKELYVEVSIIHDEETSQYTTRIQTPYGHAVTPFVFPAATSLESELQTLRQELERGLQRNSLASTSGMEQAQGFGKKLFQGLFTGKALDYYRRCRQELEDLRQPRQRLKVKIDFANFRLANLPWELMYDPAIKNFLAFDRRTSVFRSVSAHAARRLTTDIESWRILLVATNPVGTVPHNLRNEMEAIESVLRSGAPHVNLMTASLDNPRPEEFLESLRGFNPHVLHIMGYGGVGHLLLGDSKMPGAMRQNYLELTLEHMYPLRLVFLNTYETTAFLAEENVEAAHALSKAGVPAVVANQFPARYEAARRMANQFYHVLASDLPVDEALLWGRRALFQGFRELPHPTPEWAAPILYLQAESGDLFQEWLRKPDQAAGPGQHPGGPEGAGTASPNEEARTLQDRIESLKKQLYFHHRTLNLLKEQKSQLGLQTPPSIFIQIEKEEADIEMLEEELAELKHRLVELQPKKPPSEPDRPAQPQLGQWYTEARQAIEVENWKKGLELLDRIIAENEQYEDAVQLHTFATRQSLLASLYRTGMLAYNARDWSKAVDEFEEIQRHQTGYKAVSEKLAHARQEMQADGFYDTGLTYIEQQKWDQAIQVLSGLKPDEGHRRNLTDDLNYARAMQTYTQALNRVQINEDHETDWQTVINHLTPIVERRSGYREAETILGQAKNYARWLATYKKGMQKFEQKAWGEAARLFESITRETTAYRDVDTVLKQTRLQQDLATRYEQGRSYKNKQRWREARDEFRKILDLDQGYKDTAALLAEVERQLDRAERYDRAEQAYENGRFAEAIDTLKSLVREAPDYRQGKAQTRLQQWQNEAEARRLYEQAKKYMSNKAWQMAIVTLEELLERHPEGYLEAGIKLQQARRALNLETLYHQACSLMEKEQWGQAMAALAGIQELEANYKDTPARLAQARQYQQAAEATEREELFRAVADYVAGEDWPAAIQRLKDYLDQKPGDQAAVERLTEIERRQEIAARYTEAVEAFTAENWGDAAALFRQVEQDAGADYKDVAARLAQADRNRQRRQLYEQAMAALEAADFGQAESLLEQLRKIDPDNEDVRQKLAEIEARRQKAELYEQAKRAADNEQWSEAIAAYRQLLALDADYEDAVRRLAEAEQAQQLATLYRRADEAVSQKEWPRAIAAYKTILEIDRNYPNVKTRLAEVEQLQHQHNLYDLARRSEQRGDLSNALEYYQNILELDSNFFDVAEKVKILAQSLELEDRYHRSQEAVKQSRFSEAIPLLQSIVDTQPDYEDAATLLEKAKTQERLAALYGQANAAYEAHLWLEAGRLFEEIGKIKSDYLDVSEKLRVAQQQGRQDELYEQGLAALVDQDWKRAIACLSQTTPDEGRRQKQPRDLAYARGMETFAEAHQKLAARADQPEQWQTVIDFLNPIVDQEPSYREASLVLEAAKRYARLGALYKEANQATAAEDWKRAVQLFETILQRNPDYRDASQKLIWLRSRQQLAEKYQLGEQYLGWGSLPEARKIFQEIVSLDSSYRDAAGRLKQIETKIDLAERFKRALQAYGENDRETAIAQLAAIVEVEPDYRKGEVTALLEEWEQEHRVRQAYQAAEQAIAAEQWQVAVEALERLFNIDKNGFLDAAILRERARLEAKLESLYNEGRNLIQAQQWEQAGSRLKDIQALRENYQDVPALIERVEEEMVLKDQYNQARQYEEAGEWDRAIAVLEDIKQRRPEYDNIEQRLELVKYRQLLTNWYAEAEQAIEAEQWTKALKALKKIQEMGESDYKDVKPLYNLAARQQQLVTLYEEAAEAIQISDLDVAHHKLEQISKIDSGYLDVQIKLAAIRRRKQLLELYQAAEAALEEERWREAGRLYRQITDMDPGYEDAAQKLREAERRQRMRDMSALATQAIEEENWSQAIQYYQMILTQLGADAEIQARLEQAEKLQQLHLHYRNGVRAEKNGHLSEALREYRAVHALDESFKDVAGKVEELSRAVELANLYQQALQVLDDKDFLKGIPLLQKLTRTEPPYKDSGQKLAKAIEDHYGYLLSKFKRAQEYIKVGREEEGRRLLKEYQDEKDKAVWFENQ